MGSTSKAPLLAEESDRKSSSELPVRDTASEDFVDAQESPADIAAAAATAATTTASVMPASGRPHEKLITADNEPAATATATASPIPTATTDTVTAAAAAATEFTSKNLAAEAPASPQPALSMSHESFPPSKAEAQEHITHKHQQGDAAQENTHPQEEEKGARKREEEEGTEEKQSAPRQSDQLPQAQPTQVSLTEKSDDSQNQHITIHPSHPDASAGLTPAKSNSETQNEDGDRDKHLSSAPTMIAQETLHAPSDTQSNHRTVDSHGPGPLSSSSANFDDMAREKAASAREQELSDDTKSGTGSANVSAMSTDQTKHRKKSKVDGDAGSAVDSAPSLTITLLLTNGVKFSFEITSRYLKKRNQNVDGYDPFNMSVYTLKELILKEWRSEWETPPASPSSIRLISFGKMLDDKSPLSECRFSHDAPNVVHMTLRPPSVVEEENDPRTSKGATHGEREADERTPGCRCVIL
ncbi:hypothetical protein KEM56_001075 [Ascosphaera pollenicola]|nr:hypothetical protein KEM56_001075 [Ascosphaera pollenicola]